MNAVVKQKVTRAEKTAWAMNDIMIPAHMVTMVSEINAEAIERLRKLAKANGHAVPSYTAIVMKTAAYVMKNNPTANRAILGLPFFKSLFQFNNVDISVAVEKNLPFLPGMAFAPAIKNTFDKTLTEISAELQILAKCTEENHQGFAEFMRILRYVPRPISNLLINLPYYIPSLWAKYRGCAAWVNAPSKAGSDMVATTWPWPITFSFGIAKARPFVVDGRLDVCKTLPLVMVFDRRIMGGGPASRLFAEFQQILQTADVIFADEFIQTNQSFKSQINNESTPC